MKITRNQSKNNEEAGIFSDLAFLLIIFFIVLAAFTVKYSLQVTFPTSKYSDTKASVIEIILPGNDIAIYKDKTIQINQLTDFFSNEKLSTENIIIIRLKVAASCPYQQAVTFLDCAGNAGFTSINIELQDNSK